MTMHTRFLTLSTLLLVLLTACTGRRTTADTQAETDLPAICQRDTLVALTLYSSTSYFLYRGEPMGFQYELCRQFADSLGVELVMKVAASPEELIRRLQAGEGDLIAYNLNVTNQRRDSLLFCGEETLSHQVLVQRTGRGVLKDVKFSIVHMAISSLSIASRRRFRVRKSEDFTFSALHPHAAAISLTLSPYQ